MSVIIDLASRRKQRAAMNSIAHPAGVALPFEQPSDGELIAPEIRQAVCSGAYDAELVDFLGEAVRDGDRVLVIGAGLGVVSTLIAKMPGVERVIAVESDAAIAPYAQRVHAANGVPWIETVNAVMTDSGTGRVPFFSRRDLRTSSLVPDDGAWQKVMMVPLMDLNLMLTEERISLVVHNLPASPMRLLGQAALGSVERILVGNAHRGDAANPEAWPALTGRGYTAIQEGSTVLLDRSADAATRASHRTRPVCAG